ncbi:hypothetical protein [Brachyspira murdochii]|uniref:hypothetical protein n=1 Tax=Brachyspira murdochii TaxID=84378 RepID=UPI0012F50ADF|nr:hypothetical protein [Brachyspira murdochii]
MSIDESNNISDKNLENTFKDDIEDINNAASNNQEENIYDSNEEIKILDELKSNQIDIYKIIANIKKNIVNNNEQHISYITHILTLFESYKDINKLFELLTEEHNECLWKNEPIINLLFESEEYKHFDFETKKYIKYLFLFEYLLLKTLSFNIEQNISISHYTSLSTLFILLNDDDNKIDNVGNIRMYNITTANDPKEGRIVESILNKNKINIKINSYDNSITLQSSYSRNIDSLTMFRFYGKKENIEATGVSLILNNEYFNLLYEAPFYYQSETKNNIEDIDLINKKRNLYWVLYYNEKDNLLIFNPNESKYSADIVIDLNNLDKLPNKNIEDLNNEEKIKYIIEAIFKNIFDYTEKIKIKIENEEKYNNIKNKLYGYLFENIRFIIKHEAFFEEQELRMLVTSNYKSKEIKSDKNSKKLYVDYIKLFDENSNYIREIIIGSKVENNESIAEYIRKILHEKNNDRNKLDDIKVSISKAPLR